MRSRVASPSARYAWESASISTHPHIPIPAAAQGGTPEKEKARAPAGVRAFAQLDFRVRSSAAEPLRRPAQPLVERDARLPSQPRARRSRIDGAAPLLARGRGSV